MADEEPDEALVQHIIKYQIEPALLAEELGVATQMVSTDPEAEGWTVTCMGCGRTAKVERDPGKKVSVCPQCLRDFV